MKASIAQRLDCVTVYKYYAKLDLIVDCHNQDIVSDGIMLF